MQIPFVACLVEMNFLGDYLFILPSVKFWKNAPNLLFEYNIEYEGKGN